MKIGIYNAPGGEGVGGAELCVAVLAEAFAAEHEVEIVHHKQSLSSERLTEMFLVRLNGVALRYVPTAWKPYSTLRNPLARYKEARDWQASLSAGYDCFLVFTHDVPPFSHAKSAAFIVLFAASEPEHLKSFRTDRSLLVKYLKRIYTEFEWRRRLATYGEKLSISQFTRIWTQRRWHIDSEILHPPGGPPTVVDQAAKRATILSIGRFTTHGHSKRQLEMMEVYDRLSSLGVGPYEYVSVGGLTELADDRAYFERVRATGARSGARVEANVPREDLTKLLAQARIFWHASGYDIDEALHPELVEHYGISTVEAMAAGCIPIVIDRGGQREIVEHGSSGFLWNTLDELFEYTRALIEDEAMLKRMSQAAIARADLFSRAKFVAQARSIVQRLTGAAPSAPVDAHASVGP